MKKLLMLVGVMLAAGLTAVAANYDLNGDGTVDRADCEMMRAAVLSQTAPVQWDVNGDGTVDVIDLNALTNYALDGREPASRPQPRRASGTASCGLYLYDFTIAPGETKEVRLMLNTSVAWTNIQTDLVLSDGLSLTKAVIGADVLNSANWGRYSSTSYADNLSYGSDPQNLTMLWYSYGKIEKKASSAMCVATLTITASSSFSQGTITMTNGKLITYDDEAYSMLDYVCNVRADAPAQPSRFDLNGDGVVDRADYTLLVTRIADQAVYNSQFDLDGNGTVDVLDANLLLEELDTQPLSTQTYTVNGVSFKMVPVEGGTFTMGATEEQGSDADDSEKPAHQVTLSSYSIGQTEVTQALWVAVMGSNPSYFQSSTDSDYGTNLQRPVEFVSLNDCQEFITKLNQLTGQQFRLPTEAEWEYAARGGNKSKGYKYAGSNTVGDVAWYWDNIPSQSSGTRGYGTQPVGTKAPNELGLYDMSGNVFEWCQDWFGSYSSDAQTNPTGPASGSRRVARGGGWGNLARSCRVSGRCIITPTYHYDDDLGLRLAQ